MEKIPRIGFGTYKLHGNTCYDSVICALNCGYRHIDTANLYKNEKDIGDAIKYSIKHSNIQRSDIWITTKIQIKDLDTCDTMYNSIKNSLKELDVEYIDLVLLHGPNDIIEDIPKTWSFLEDVILGYVEDLKDKIRYIGISNYDIKHIELLKSSRIKPYVNQFEVNPYLYRNDLIEYCKGNDIIPVAHSSFVFGKKLDDNRLISLSTTLNLSPSKILLGWAINKGLYILPRSSNPAHIKDNIDNVEKIKLDKDTVDYLDTLYKYDNNTSIGYSIYPKYIVK